MGHLSVADQKKANLERARELDLSKGFDIGLPIATAVLGLVPVIGQVLGLFSLFFKSRAQKNLENFNEIKKSGPAWLWNAAKQRVGLRLPITREFLDRLHIAGDIAFPSWDPVRVDVTNTILVALGTDPIHAERARALIASVPETVGPLNMPIGFNLGVNTAWPQPGQPGAQPLGIGPTGMPQLLSSFLPTGLGNRAVQNAQQALVAAGFPPGAVPQSGLNAFQPSGVTDMGLFSALAGVTSSIGAGIGAIGGGIGSAIGAIGGSLGQIIPGALNLVGGVLGIPGVLGGGQQVVQPRALGTGPVTSLSGFGSSSFGPGATVTGIPFATLAQGTMTQQLTAEARELASGGLASPFKVTCGGSRLAAQTHIQINPVTGSLTWFKPAGKPILWSGDLAATKRVARIAKRARRSRGKR